MAILLVCRNLPAIPGDLRRTLTSDPQSASMNALIVNLVRSRGGSACPRAALSENGGFWPRRPRVLRTLPPVNPIDERAVAAKARRVRLLPALLACALLAAGACYVVPRGLEAQHLFAIEDDPVQIAERALDQKFNAAVAKPRSTRRW